MIALVDDEVDEPRLYGADDLPWIAQLLDLVEEARGQPWRVMVERVEHAALGVGRADRTAIVRALRRVVAERHRAQLALSLTELAWFELVADRPVVLPRGRPAEAELAAHANLERIQRCARRAHELQLRIWDGAPAMARAAARRGLIVEAQTDGASTQLAVLGPLALLHSTVVYGRAVAGLIPLLARHARFELDVRCQLRGVETVLRVAPPVLLPPLARGARLIPGAAALLARDLAERGHAVEHEPAPIALGPQLLFPDLAVRHAGTRWLVEILGFSTPRSIDLRLAGYRQAHQPAVLCVESSTALASELAPNVCDYRRRVDVDALLASFEATL